ncbi:MAG: S8 family serine peptidase [Bacteroidetes bacterium]|nr:S8 family serine peptidase [Bacteroidota bacterium]
MVNDGTGMLVTHPVKIPIDALRAVGIATIISSGNDFGNNVISTPACISSAISVSSIDDFGDPTKYANQASFLDFFAPGGNFSDSAINSSIPGNNFGLKFGTSMAAPHVTGAWALLRAANITASVDDIFTALSDTGILKTLRNAANGEKPLIQLDQALAQVIGNTCDRPITDFATIISGTSGVDKISGTSGDDLILGFGGDDHIQGNGGNDCIIGGDGVDRISGGPGNDHIYGGDGEDHLKGDEDNNLLVGGDDNDILSGGPG